MVQREGRLNRSCRREVLLALLFLVGPIEELTGTVGNHDQPDSHRFREIAEESLYRLIVASAKHISEGGRPFQKACHHFQTLKSLFLLTSKDRFGGHEVLLKTVDEFGSEIGENHGETSP